MPSISFFQRSPFAWAVGVYRNKYHLKYRNAKKLFVFDIALLLSIVVIGAAGIFWWTYDPTISDLVIVSITPSKDKIKSGEQADFTITYENASDVALLEPQLKITPPSGFIIANEQTVITLDTLGPKSKGETTISGRFFGTPETAYPFDAELSYRQETRTVREMSRAHLLVIPRDSVLTTELKTPAKIFREGSAPITITLKNTGGTDLAGISLPTTVGQDLSIRFASDTERTIPQLAPQESKTIETTLRASLSSLQKTVMLNFTPEITVNNSVFPQTKITKTLEVLTPQLTLEMAWKDETRTASPGDVVPLNITMTNNGEINFADLKLVVPVSDGMMNGVKLAQLNNGVLSKGIVTINAADRLAQGAQHTLTLRVPIAKSISTGTDVSLIVTPFVQAAIAEVTTMSFTPTPREVWGFTKSASSPPLKIGTSLTMEANTRYYTEEGDQIGRGPLPPRVGEHTKYWALITISNTTSKVENVRFSATLPSYVSWSGKTSVLNGPDIEFNPDTRRVSWSGVTLAPHERNGVYFEVGLTPTEEQRGTTPLLVTDIKLNGTDTFIEKELLVRANNLDARLKGDEKAEGKGVRVE